MTDEQEDNDKGGITRRDLLGPGAMGAGLLAYSAAASEKAAAQVGSEPLIQLGDKYEFDEDASGNLIIRHVDNGEVFKYDQTADQITDVKPFQSIVTDKRTITDVGTTVFKTTDQSISNASITKIQFDGPDSEDADVVSFDSVNYNLDIKQDGDYLLLGYVRWRDDTGWSTGDRVDVLPHVNGNIVFDGYQRKIGTETQEILVPPFHREFVNGDTIDLRAYQDSGTSQTVYGEGTDNDPSATAFSVVKIG